MNAYEWGIATNSLAMLRLVERKASARKLRLLACACCRQVWNPFVPKLAVRVVRIAEAFADSEVSAWDLAGVHESATLVATEAIRDTSDTDSGYRAHIMGAAAHATHSHALTAAALAIQDSALAAADAPVRGLLRGGLVPDSYRPAEYIAELAAQADLIRDIFHPFREVRIKPAWLTSDVLALAQGIYANRSFGGMPVLADALQDAGCDDKDILHHCRNGHVHVRGCWVVDLLLGKK